MSGLDKNSDYLKASLREMILRLQYPSALSAREIVQNGRVAQTLLFILDRLDALENKQ